MRRPSPALLLALAALVVSLGGTAIATIPANDGDVHACYSKNTGEIELVDTQRDRFGCPRNWDGLTIDTEPTQLVSPNGSFRATVSNTSAKLSGPSGRVEITGPKITIDANAPLDLKSSSTIDLRAGVVRINGTPQSGE